MEEASHSSRMVVMSLILGPPGGRATRICHDAKYDASPSITWMFPVSALGGQDDRGKKTEASILVRKALVGTGPRERALVLRLQKQLDSSRGPLMPIRRLSWMAEADRVGAETCMAKPKTKALIT